MTLPTFLTELLASCKYFMKSFVYQWGITKKAIIMCRYATYGNMPSIANGTIVDAVRLCLL